MQRAPLDATDLAAAIEAERPDALLVDGNAWGAGVTAEASGLPWATWMPYLLPLPSRDAPPWGPGLAPAHGPLGRARDRVIGSFLTRRNNAIVLDRTNAARASAPSSDRSCPARISS